MDFFHYLLDLEHLKNVSGFQTAFGL